MSEENLSDLLERSADRHNVGSPPLDQMLSRSQRARKRRAGFMALAASVVVASVITGTTALFDSDDSSPGPVDGSILPSDQWKTVAYKGVLLDIPTPWEKSDVSGCEFRFEGWSSPATDPCKFTEGVRFYGSALFDPANRPNTIGARSDGQGFMGWVYAGDFAVSVSGPSRDFVQRVLDSAREADASPINLEGEWVLTALTDADGKSALGDSYAKTMRLAFTGGTFEGTTGCNSLFGNYVQGGDDGRDFDFTNVGTTKMACPNEPPLRDRLRNVRHVSETDSEIRLHAENWMIVAVLERVDASSTQRSSGVSYEDTLTTLTSYDGKPGFGKVVVNESKKHIDVYWKGEVPTDVQRLVGIGKDGTVVAVRSARYSSEDYRLAGRRVFAKMRELQGSFAGTTSGNSDMTGMVLRTPVLLSEAELAEVVEVAGMPVKQVKGSPTVDLGGATPLSEATSK